MAGAHGVVRQAPTRAPVGALAAQTAIGYGLGQEDLDLLIKGFSDTLTGKTSHRELSPHFAAIRPALDARRERRLAEIRAEHRAYYQRVKDEGTHREIAPGVLFSSIAEGKGDSPAPGQQVTIRFKEALYGHETPLTKDDKGETKSFTVPLGNVMPCWREALTHMKPAGRARLVCHDGAAFGPGGRPPFVPGGATMLYELELLSVANAPPVTSANQGHDGHAFLKELALKGKP